MKTIIIADCKTNTISATKQSNGDIKIFDLSGECYYLTPDEYRDREHLNYIISMFHGFSHFFNHADDFDHDGLLGA